MYGPAREMYRGQEHAELGYCGIGVVGLGVQGYWSSGELECWGYRRQLIHNLVLTRTW
jgi:hypothetical protein